MQPLINWARLGVSRTGVSQCLGWGRESRPPAAQGPSSMKKREDAARNAIVAQKMGLSVSDWDLFNLGEVSRASFRFNRLQELTRLREEARSSRSPESVKAFEAYERNHFMAELNEARFETQLWGEDISRSQMRGWLIATGLMAVIFTKALGVWSGVLAAALVAQTVSIRIDRQRNERASRAEVWRRKWAELHKRNLSGKDRWWQWYADEDNRPEPLPEMPTGSARHSSVPV